MPICARCNGKGSIDCAKCEGRGVVEDSQLELITGTARNGPECPQCRGTGTVTCPDARAPGKWMITTIKDGALPRPVAPACAALRRPNRANDAGAGGLLNVSAPLQVQVESLARQRGEIGVDMLRAGGLEFLRGVRARCDQKTGKPALVRGLGVEGRVADEAGGRRVGAERGEHMGREPGVGLQPRSVLRAENAAEQRRDAEVIAHQARRGAVLVGEDRQRAAAGMQGAQQFAGSGHQLDAVEHGPVPVGAVNLQGAGEIGLAHETAHGVLQAAADGAPDLFAGGRGQPELRQGVRVAAVDRRQVVEQRAVEVEQYGPVAHAGEKERHANTRKNQAAAMADEPAKNSGEVGDERLNVCP